jgi:two-component system CheB/CheR fusion protein
MNEREKPRKFPIVGIGASAGGVEALSGFFKGVPPNSGLAYVVVTHLSPDRESLLHQVVGRYTDLPVQIAADRTVVEPNKVYVLPADGVLGIEGGRLQVRKLGASRRERKPIDLFLSALARDCGEYAAGVILSGGDADGTLGIKAIKERGGLTLAQVADGSGPSHRAMPDSAISSGLIDLAIPADQMGARLVEFSHGFEMLDRIASTDAQAKGTHSWENARQEIYSLLRNQVGHDFEGYKINTFVRRVQRRMQITQIETVEAYVERLRQDSREVHALFRDLLIHVTNFFRDTEAFEALREHVIPKLFEGRGANDTVRVWIPACATGEEVFSIAILLREHVDSLSAVPRIQIFATDIDDTALTAARAARYPETLLESLSEERRRRFFTSDGGTFHLSKEVRDLCTFSPHSVLRDPPFSRIDLVSCRNLLIYFGADLQNQVVPIFHYSLRPGGYLFLGLSENASQFSDLFTPVDKKNRIFRSRHDVRPMARVPLFVRGLATERRNEPNAESLAYTTGTGIRQIVDREILEQHAPPHVLVNSEGDVVYFSARIGKYLEPPQGTPNRNIFAMARPSLRLDLRAALREAVADNRKVVRDRIVLETEEERVQHVTLTIQPLPSRIQDESLFLVIFSDTGPELSRKGTQIVRSDDAAAQLERELRETRERLQGMIEEYETAIEELKSSNEELVSVNEELQSTNEELESSKEEVQSLNEELHTVNIELASKLDDLERSKNDLENLFVSTQVATVFLDQNLIIRNFTPAASAIFTIRGGDAGRPLSDFSSRLPLPYLQDDVRSVLQNGMPIERPIENADGTLNYFSRLIPYKGTDAKVEGVVLTFVDVTSLIKAQAQQRVLVAELNHRVKNMLTIAIAIIEQTRIGGKTPEQFKKSLIDRLRSMARSYGSLSRENWEGVPIQELVTQELEPFGRERFVFEGPDIHLKPRVALPLGMIFHELATNAAKYGALSMEDGKVKISVETTEDQLTLEWREMGGPPVADPAEYGFGMKLVKNEARHNLGGTMELKFDPAGLVAVLQCKL